MILLCIFLVLVMGEVIEAWYWYRGANIEKEVTKGVIALVCFLGLGILMVRYYHLSMKYQILYLMMHLIVGILVWSWLIKKKHHQDAFNELCEVLLKLSIYYRFHQKTYAALKAVITEIDGIHKESLQDVLVVVGRGEGLDSLSEKLSSHYLVHTLIAIVNSSENMGMIHVNRQLLAFENDVEALQLRTNQYQSQESKHRIKTILMLGVSLGVGYLAIEMLLSTVRLSTQVSYQVIVFGYLVSLLCCFMIVMRRSQESWILEKECLV